MRIAQQELPATPEEEPSGAVPLIGDSLQLLRLRSIIWVSPEVCECCYTIAVVPDIARRDISLNSRQRPCRRPKKNLIPTPYPSFSPLLD